MDCIEAQRIVSEAIDKVALDDVVVEKAKLHCASCPECNAFVRGLAKSMRAGLPEPADDLPDRIMQAVRLEAARSSIRAVKPAEEAASPSTVLPAPGVNPPVRDRRTTRWLASWAAAAAVVLLAAGIFANQGVRDILKPVERNSEVTFDTMSAPESAQAPSDSAAGSSAQSSTEATQVVAGDYISFNGIAYLRAGLVPDVDPATLTVVGATSSALSPTGAPFSVTVRGSQDPSRLFIAMPDGSLAAFDRVTRIYQGMVYELQTAPIERFATWPSLPATLGRPSSADGSPLFRELETDETGARIFEPMTGGTDIGIAIAPDSPPVDAARGNPDWTWWTPVR